MKTMNAMNATSAVLALMIGSAAVAADDAGWYIGANAGEARATIVESEVRSSLLASGFTMTAYDEDERHFGYKVFGGYQFSRFFAMEGGYFDLGKFSFDADTLPAGSLRGLIDVRGANFDLVGMLPFTDRFSAFVRGGANYAEVRDTFDATGAVNVLERKRRERKPITSSAADCSTRSPTRSRCASRQSAIGSTMRWATAPIWTCCRWACCIDSAGRRPLPCPSPIALQ